MVHGVKTAADIKLAARHFRHFPPSQGAIEACLAGGDPPSPQGDSWGSYARLAHFDGYQRTNHSRQPRAQQADETAAPSLLLDSRGRWRTFTMDDCGPGSNLGSPLVAAMPSSAACRVGELAVVDAALAPRAGGLAREVLERAADFQIAGLSFIDAVRQVATRVAPA